MIDPAQFRAVLAHFPSGVVVVTATGEDGRDYGLTLTAFFSISAAPPLVAVSLNLTSNTLPAVREAQGFTVNVMDSGHEEVATRFATKDDDKFSGLDLIRTGVGGPVLAGHACAYLVCRVAQEVTVGDHVLVIGEVAEAEVLPDRVPLLYGQRRYSAWPYAAEPTV
jgi:flavin reductase ActVB